MARELDVRVAKALGCNVLSTDFGCYCDCGPPWPHGTIGEQINGYLLKYSTDHTAARAMADTLEGDAQSDYVFELSIIVTQGIVYPPLEWAWRMRSATPEQRCRAFLKVVETPTTAQP